MIFAGILAGGTGSRMGLDIPKQFLKLGERPIIIHTIEKFLITNKFEKVVVAVHPDWITSFEDLLEKYLPSSKNAILVTYGGGDRNSSIQNILTKIEENYDLTAEDIIITHDSVRPFINIRTILDNIEALDKYVAVDTVVPATDTIVVSNDHTSITDIPRRDFMYQGQTPQSFRILKFKTLYESLTEDEKSILTDACKIFIIKGENVGLVQGEYSNIKITTITDLKIAQALLGAKND